MKKGFVSILVAILATAVAIGSLIYAERANHAATVAAQNAATLASDNAKFGSVSQTQLTDTIGTFRTNVNTDLSNLDTKLTAVSSTLDTRGTLFTVSSPLPVANGGTALGSQPTDRQVLTAVAGVMGYKALTASSGITISTDTNAIYFSTVGFDATVNINFTGNDTFAGSTTFNGLTHLASTTTVTQTSQLLYATSTGVVTGLNVSTGLTLSGGALTAYAVGVGHVNTSGSAPALSGCNGAGSSIAGTDFVGLVTSQTSATTTCTISFASAYASTPVCVVSTANNLAVNLANLTNSSFQVIFASNPNIKINYICVGNPN